MPYHYLHMRDPRVFRQWEWLCSQTTAMSLTMFGGLREEKGCSDRDADGELRRKNKAGPATCSDLPVKRVGGYRLQEHAMRCDAM